MFQTVSQLLPEVLLILVTAVATHLVMSFAQTLMHYKLGHHPMGGKFFRNHINFHHTYYSKDHLVSRTYLGDEGNNTPFFFVPVFLVGGCAYFILPLNLFVVLVIACASVCDVFVPRGPPLKSQNQGRSFGACGWSMMRPTMTLRTRSRTT